MKNYPSSKRDRLIVAIKEGINSLYGILCVEFHDHAKETDPKKIEVYRNDAQAGLMQIEQYVKNNTRGSMTYTLGE